jgi:hypothetical protein
VILHNVAVRQLALVEQTGVVRILTVCSVNNPGDIRKQSMVTARCFADDVECAWTIEITARTPAQHINVD